MAVDPYSAPTVAISSPGGRWILSSEGGGMRFIPFDGLNPATPGLAVPTALPMPREKHECPVGTVGVMAAEMVLDPDADLEDDASNSPRDPVADAHDIVYVAGGHHGLWAMEAHPATGHDNIAVRLDDSGNADPATQFSQRFCTSVAVAELGGEQVLLALFARADKNALRIYRLQDARDALDAVRSPSNTNVPRDLGYEIAPLRSVGITVHPNEPARGAASVGRSYATNMALDESPVEFSGTGHTFRTNVLDVYVSLMTSGVIRVRFTAQLDVGGSGLVGALATKDWSPVFGDGTPHATAVSGTSLNASMLPAYFYENREWMETARSSEFQDILRDDPPHFLHLALQNEVDPSGAGAYFLYAAVDHLNWVRFDLRDAWGAGTRIDHHEGVPSVTPTPNGDVTSWGKILDLDAATSGPLFEPLRGAVDGAPVGAIGRQVKYATTLQLTRIADATEPRTALVVGYIRDPWTLEARIKGPARMLDVTFTQIGTYSFEMLAAYHTIKTTLYDLTKATPPVDSSKDRTPALVVYDHLENLTPLHVGGASNATPNVTRWYPFGADDICVLPQQTVAINGNAEYLRVLHTDAVVAPKPEDIESEAASVCVTFFDLSNQISGPTANERVWIRDGETSILGRATRGAAFALGDPRIAIHGINDYPVTTEGLPWTQELGGGQIALQRDPNPSPGTLDRRLNTGIICNKRSQWQVTPGNSTSDLWVAGEFTVPGSTVRHWYFQRNTISAAPSVVTVAEEFLKQPGDRYRDAQPRPYYAAGVTSPEYDAYTLDPSNVSSPDSYIFLSRGATLDGVVVFKRGRMMTDMAFSFDQVNQIAVPAQGGNGAGNLWDGFMLNTHPTWNNFDFFNDDPSNSTDVAFNTAKACFEFILGPTLEGAASYSFPPVPALLGEAGNPQSDLWALFVPSGMGTCDPDIDLKLNAGGALRSDTPAKNFPTIPAAFRPSAARTAEFRHGVVHVWDISDPDALTADANMGASGGGLPPTPFDPNPRPIGTTDLDPLLLRGSLDSNGQARDSSAFDVEVVSLGRDDGSGGTEWRDIAFVVDFAGGLEAFDVTDILTNLTGSYRRHVGYQPPGQPQSPHAWQPPLELLEGRTSNCYDVAIVPATEDVGVVDVYLAVSRLGIYAIRYDIDTGFTAPEDSVRIKTSGEPHSVEVREIAGGTLMMVADHTGGMRYYVRRLEE